MVELGQPFPLFGATVPGLIDLQQKKPVDAFDQLVSQISLFS